MRRCGRGRCVVQWVVAAAIAGARGSRRRCARRGRWSGPERSGATGARRSGDDRVAGGAFSPSPPPPPPHTTRVRGCRGGGGGGTRAMRAPHRRARGGGCGPRPLGGGGRRGSRAYPGGVVAGRFAAPPRPPPAVAPRVEGVTPPRLGRCKLGGPPRGGGAGIPGLHEGPRRSPLPAYLLTHAKRGHSGFRAGACPLRPPARAVRTLTFGKDCARRAAGGGVEGPLRPSRGGRVPCAASHS